MSRILPYEQEVALHPRIFNFEGMSDEQISALGRAIVACVWHDYTKDNYNGGDYSGGDVADSLTPFYVGEMSRLLDSDADRAKRLIVQAAVSKDGYDKDAAVSCAALPLARHDFALAKDVLVHVAITGWNCAEPNSPAEMADQGLYDLKDELPADQAAEAVAACEMVHQVVHYGHPYQVPPSLAG